MRLVHEGHLQIVERRREEDELSVLTLHRQESAQQWFRSRSDDQVDVANVERGANVSVFSQSSIMRGTQLVVRVIGGQNVDPETVTRHDGLQLLRSGEIRLRQQAPIAVQPHTADGGVEASGNQRGEEVDGGLVHGHQLIVGSRQIGLAQVVHRHGVNVVSLQGNEDVGDLLSAADGRRRQGTRRWRSPSAVIRRVSVPRELAGGARASPNHRKSCHLHGPLLVRQKFCAAITLKPQAQSSAPRSTASTVRIRTLKSRYRDQFSM